MGIKKGLYILLFAVFLICLPDCAYGGQKKVTIVIDPGHGGDNSGASFQGKKEKDLTLQIATELKRKLESYPNAEVWLTRTEDDTMSLKQRAEFAEEHEADLLISLHLNASAEHNQFGAEVWVSAFDIYYKRGYEAGYYFLKEWKNLGLANRGVKTRLGEGMKDYYGIIREARERKIPAIILEHCFMDHDRDEPYFNTEEALTELAQADCKALVQCFGLDNVKRAAVVVPETDDIMYPPITPPEQVWLQVTKDRKGKALTLEMEASEIPGILTYFDYSTDGGKTWSDLELWNGENSSRVRIDWDGRKKAVTVRIYNGYLRYTQSNIVSIEHYQKPLWKIGILSFLLTMIWSCIGLFLFLLYRHSRLENRK